MRPDNLSLSSPAASQAAAVPAAPPPTALAPGFRFHPTDEELVIYYLKRKVRGKAFRFSAISEVDIYKSEPWDLAGKSRLKSRDQEYYFFSVLDKKYGNGARMNRATSQGYWKATGNDRPVRHDSKTVGLKKTLVFHSGRAPDGKRTNWVMHEYRLVDDYTEQSCVAAGAETTRDGYVLCRVFHKSHIGPPSGHRYAPFIEGEWDDDDKSVLVPGEEARDGLLSIHNARVEANYEDACAEGKHSKPFNDGKDQVAFVDEKVEQETEDKAPARAIESRTDFQKVMFVCKDERRENYTPPSIIANPKPFSLMKCKKRRHDDSNSDISNISESSTRTSEEPCSSTTTSAVTATPTIVNSTRPTTKNFLSALVEYSLLESIEPKDPLLPPPALEAAKMNSSIHPSILKFIQELQNEIHQISVERETVKFELLSAQAMIGILQSRIDNLNKENDKLKKSARDVP